MCSCFVLLLLFFSSCSYYVSGQRGMLRIYSSDFRVGRVDPITAEIYCEVPLILPNTSASCKWTLDSGDYMPTRGQSQAIFYVNQTFFFFAQEICLTSSTESIYEITKTTLFSTIGPFCEDYGQIPVYLRALASFDYIKVGLEQLNVAWDHTCNLVVIAPEPQEENGYIVNQVSEYDSAQRFQPKYSTLPGWRKASATGALDFGQFQPTHPQDQELYCGDDCLFYTIEERINTKPTLPPRYFIGRSYRTSSVLLNITDSVQIQSLSWNPWVYNARQVNQLIGIGLCCVENWCHPDCTKYNKNLVLVSFTRSGGFTILAEIGEIDDTTVQVGVEYSEAPYTVDYKIYVLHMNSIVSFDLKMNNGVILGAVQSNVSPPIGSDFGRIRMWANSGSL